MSTVSCPVCLRWVRGVEISVVVLLGWFDTLLSPETSGADESRVRREARLVVLLLLVKLIVVVSI